MQSRWMAITLMTLAGACYGLVTPLAKGAALAGVPVRLYTPLQYVLPLVLLALMALRQRRLIPPSSKERINGAAVGALGAATAVTYYEAVRLLPADEAVMLLFQFSWILPLIGWALSARRPTYPQALAIFIIWVGTLISTRAFSPNGWGLAFGLLAALFYALMLYLQGRLPSDTSVWESARLSTLTGAVLATLLDRPWQMPLTHPITSWGWASAIGLTGQALPLVLTYQAAPVLGETLTAVLASAELPVAVIVSQLAFREPARWPVWAGVVLIVSGIMLGALS